MLAMFGELLEPKRCINSFTLNFFSIKTTCSFLSILAVFISAVHHDIRFLGQSHVQ